MHILNISVTPLVSNKIMENLRRNKSQLAYTKNKQNKPTTRKNVVRTPEQTQPLSIVTQN